MKELCEEILEGLKNVRRDNTNVPYYHWLIDGIAKQMRVRDVGNRNALRELILLQDANQKPKELWICFMLDRDGTFRIRLKELELPTLDLASEMNGRDMSFPSLVCRAAVCDKGVQMKSAVGICDGNEVDPESVGVQSSI